MAAKSPLTPPRYQPTPAEIKRACEEIQKRWTDRERRRRAGEDPDSGWTPPVVSSSELIGDTNGVDRAA